MGFSACSDVGARFTGAGAKAVVLCSSAYTARSRNISRQRHARIALAMFRSVIDARGACTQAPGVANPSWLQASVLLAASRSGPRPSTLSKGVCRVRASGERDQGRGGKSVLRFGRQTVAWKTCKTWPKSWLRLKLLRRVRREVDIYKKQRRLWHNF